MGKPACSISFATKQSVAPGTTPGPPSRKIWRSRDVRDAIWSFSLPYRGMTVRYASPVTGLRSVPMLVMSISTVSPGTG